MNLHTPPAPRLSGNVQATPTPNIVSPYNSATAAPLFIPAAEYLARMRADTDPDG